MSFETFWFERSVEQRPVRVTARVIPTGFVAVVQFFFDLEVGILVVFRVCRRRECMAKARHTTTRVTGRSGWQHRCGEIRGGLADDRVERALRVPIQLLVVAKQKVEALVSRVGRCWRRCGKETS